MRLQEAKGFRIGSSSKKKSLEEVWVLEGLGPPPEDKETQKVLNEGWSGFYPRLA